MRDPRQTERLLLRPFRPADLEPLHEMWSDPEIGPWVGGVHASRQESEDELDAHVRHQQRHGFGFWAVEERASGDVVGEVGLMLFEGRGPEVEIGWCIARDSWRRGYAREAATAWLEAAFGELGLDRVIAVVLPENERSTGLCEALGMTRAGRRRAYGREHLLFEISARTFAARARRGGASSASPR